MPMASAAEDNDFDRLERAVQRAIALREAVSDLADPMLCEMIDTILIELGRKVAGHA